MNEQVQNRYAPEFVSSPGETLEEVLEDRRMSQSEFAERTGRPKKTINEIVKGKAAITPETAIQFERVLGVPASFWMAREQNYRESLARAKELEELKGQAAWLDEIPFRAMARLGWVSQYKDKALQLEEALKFFGVASPSSWAGVWGAEAASFRKSAKLSSDPGAIAAWLRKGEIEASIRSCRDFDEKAFRAVLTQLRSITRESPKSYLPQLQQMCALSGVAVVFVPELPGTRVWGATRWLGTSRAILQLSLRYKTDDHLWFTFFHEAAHILLHNKRAVFVEEDSAEKGEKEREADAFASEWLVPKSQYRAFCRKGAFSCAAASRFAHEIGIAPGIIVGRLQRDGYMGRANCNDLKKKLDWVFEAERG